MGVSVETVIAGARALALMRERECAEICLDETADQRPRALHGSQQIVGLLSNVLPLRITGPGDESLSVWLQDIESKRTKLQSYGHVSGSQIKPWLDDAPLAEPENELEFSLFYFADDNAVYGEDKYRLYREGAIFADRHRLAAVWTPERHFHEKAGLYPNPSVLSAGLAMITKNVQLRAGSVVLPLHNSLRVAEEWSVVDNLSKGRVGVSFTSGWMPNDFAFFPERYATKREEMFRGMKEVQELWRGEPIAGRDGVGKEIELRIFPKPIQPELPIWLTCSGGPEMFEKAGELGCHVLTALLTQSIEEVTPKIKLYRDSLAKHGHDPRSGKVVMMMHTFIGEDAQAVLQKVRAPLTKYLKSHLNLIETGAESLNLDVDVREQDAERVRDQMAGFAFERYYRTSSLIGTPSSCMKMVERLKAIGVDEVACLIDFGIDVDSVLESLEHLVVLRDLSKAAHAEERLLATTSAHV
jgi:natural product biosynthesis luciferase-like monooxygenase protein